jgi:hypothetical protein
MKDGFIIIVISNKGVEKIKLYHGKDKEAMDNTLRLYGWIMPYLKRLEKLVIASQKEKIDERNKSNRNSPS